MLKDRRIAWIVLILCVLMSVFAFGGGGLRAARNRAVSVFMDGVDPSETAGGVKLSMDQYFKDSAKYATVMAEECKRCVSPDDETAARVLTLAEQVASGSDPNPRVIAYRKLAAEVESLYTVFHSASLTEAEMEVFSENYADFTRGAASKIKYDGYNDAAKEYNNAHGGILEKAVGGLLGLRALELI